MTATARIVFAVLVVRDVRRVLRRPGAQEHAAQRAGRARDAVLLAQPRRPLRPQRMSFFLKRTDDVTATVVNRAGDEIRVLAERRLRGRAADAPGLGRHGRRAAAPSPTASTASA